MSKGKHYDYYKDKTILVTGGAGAIGTNLSRILAETGAKRVMILDDLSSGARWNVPSMPNTLFVEGDILDETVLKHVFFEEPDVVFHLAAFFANQNSIDYPERDLMVNGLGTLRMLLYSKMMSVDRFVFASSGSSIYGLDAPLPLKEEQMSLHLATPYQITKMLGELYCNFYCDYSEMKIVRPRFFNSYGPGEVPGQYRNVIPNFIYLAMKGRPLPITGTGGETRDFTFVEDVVDGILRAGSMEEAVGEELNLASGIETQIIDVANTINELTNNEAGIVFTERRKWDIKSRRLASVEKARSLLGYEPKTVLADGIRKTVDWFRENWNNIEQSATFGPGMSSAVRGYVPTSSK
ncbi:NAD-dependent epimerase/dehydratase family protein [Candidatus Hydrogenedentota bacterium]